MCEETGMMKVYREVKVILGDPITYKIGVAHKKPFNFFLEPGEYKGQAFKENDEWIVYLERRGSSNPKKIKISEFVLIIAGAEIKIL